MSRSTYWRQAASSPLHLLQNEFHRILEEYLQPRPGGAEPPPAHPDRTAWNPAVDVYETPEETIVVVEVPGVDSASIELAVTGNVLSMRGVKQAGDLPEAMLQVRERKLGAFHRELTLPNEVDFDNAQAEAIQGVLRVRLPKRSSAKPRTIPITRG
jgi:HSP20 family protein